MAKKKSKARAKRKAKPIVMVAAFGDLRTLAKHGFYCRLDDVESTLFDRHPEKAKLAAKSVDAAMKLASAVIKACQWTKGRAGSVPSRAPRHTPL